MVMEGLEIPISQTFIQKAVAVFANDKVELDESDFLLLVGPNTALMHPYYTPTIPLIHP